jgi:UDP-apiose/xylose synthase
MERKTGSRDRFASGRPWGRLCVIGAGGFIGSHLIARLCEEGAGDITAVDLTSEKIQPCLGRPGVTFVKLDIGDTAALRKHVEDADTVVMLAALCNPALYTTVPIEVIESNFLRPLSIVKLCAGLDRRLIHFSSSEVYGTTLSHHVAGPADGLRGSEGMYVLDEDRSPLILGPVAAQRWCYAAAKQLLERTIFAYGFERRLRYTIIRPFNFIGPRMDYIPGIDGEGVPRVLACFMEALMSGRALKLVGGGRNRRCFTFIDDAVDAIAAILREPEKTDGEIFNIGNPANEVTIRQLAEMMIDIYKQICPKYSDADFILETVSPESFYGPGYEDSDRRMPDITKAARLLGWAPRTGLRTALHHTMQWFISAYGDECACREAC